MRFIVQQTVLLGALHKIIGVIPAKTTISILSSFLFELNNDNLKITGTDLEISVSTSIDVNGQEDGSIAIPAKIILEIVRELPDIPLDISSEEDSRVSIITEKGLYRISGDSKDDFPNIIVEDSEGSTEMDSAKLHRMITKTMFAVSTDELRTALMGVYFQIMEDEFKLVSTDGHRLVKIVDKNFRSPSFQINVIVPTKALNILLRNMEASLIEANEKINLQDLEFGGEAKEEIPADYNSDDLEIGYNSYYILDILKNIDTDEVVIMLKNATSAAIFYPITQIAGEDLMMLVMPIRLVDE